MTNLQPILKHTWKTYLAYLQIETAVFSRGSPQLLENQDKFQGKDSAETVVVIDSRHPLRGLSA